MYYGKDVQGAILLVPNKRARLVRNLIENVGNERVYDALSLGRDVGVGMNLFEQLVSIDAVALVFIPFFFSPSGFGFFSLGAFSFLAVGRIPPKPIGCIISCCYSIKNCS